VEPDRELWGRFWYEDSGGGGGLISKRICACLKNFPTHLSHHRTHGASGIAASDRAWEGFVPNVAQPIAQAVRTSAHIRCAGHQESCAEGSNPTLDDSGRELVEAAKQEVGRLSNLSRETLAPHRETKLPVVTKVSELLDDALTMFRRKLETAQIEVRSEYQTEGEVTIYPGELRQVFANLITNAVDAMGKRGELSLSIETMPDRQVAVRIADTGCGIPSENLKTIFEPFFTTKGDKGTGIGLWVTKSLVEKVGGRIEVVSSTTGRNGTCFSIFLPMTKAGTREQRGVTK
jgi:signal transduction histidine kinase